MALPIHLALVSEGVNISSSDLTRVASALSKQVDRDFQPFWRVDATVDSFVRLEDVPTDYWPIVVMRNVQGAAGYHQDEDGQPYAVVEFGDQWSLTASHECLEMLADPFGRRLRAGNLLDQAVQLGLPAKRVRYLVEVCDPSESGEFSYQVNGIQVSDFYTPHFFEPVPTPGVRYSFTGAIGAPRKILEGGYISWKESTSRHWFQLRMFPDEFSSKVPHVLDLSADTVFEKLKTAQGLRGAIDRVTKPPQYRAGLRGAALMAARVGSDTSIEAQESRAEDLRRAIAGLREAPKPRGRKRPKRSGR
jgi:hypothetical protein